MIISKADANELIHQIALKLTKGLGNVGTRKILHQFGNAINFFDHVRSTKPTKKLRISDDILQQLKASSIMDAAKKELDYCIENDLSLIHI